MQESDELDQLQPVPAVDPGDLVDVTPPVPRHERVRVTPSTMHQTPNPDGSNAYAFEGGHVFALITDQGYVAYRIPEDHTS